MGSGKANSQLCMELMRSENEAEVIEILQREGYWDKPELWRPIGDNENNFSTVGNQQSEAIAALVEKIVNSVDHRLINACRIRGIDPESPSAPQSIREAVAVLFEGRTGLDSENAGRIATWADSDATRQGRLLTVAVTGAKPGEGDPSISIADQGEGQPPDGFPSTFMSLASSNKLRIPFVQGKFNMGGTGALSFCGQDFRVQLIVSRRNPALLPPSASSRDREWGFTIVRREPPTGNVRSSMYTYLAPVGVGAPRTGNVLSFASDRWPIFPQINDEMNDAYGRESEFGSLVKLYEYTWSGTTSSVIMTGDGLLRRLDQALPELALPVRIFECRPYRGEPRSFSTNILGISARLERDRADKMEHGFPEASVIDVDGAKIPVKVFAFKPGQAKDYRTQRNAIIFAINGQSHATLSADFFRRKRVKMGYLADSLFVTVDCTGVKGQQREDLFMNSRDRLRATTVSDRLEREVEEFLRTNQALRDLRNARRESELQEKLEDDRPLATALEELMKQSPMLSRLFLQGINISAPFPPKSGGGGGKADKFEGKTYPTYFRFYGMKDGETLKRPAHIGSRVRLTFETDANKDYFTRELDQGTWQVARVGPNGDRTPLPNCRLDGPTDGVAHLHLQLPSDIAEGEVVHAELEVTDPSRIEPFLNKAVLDVRKERKPGPGGTGGRTNRNKGSDGNKGSTSTLALPEIERVDESDWERRPGQHDWNEESALVIVDAGEDERTTYDFYVNVANKYLKAFQKERKEDPRLLEKKFVYSLVLMGLALIQADQADPESDDANDRPASESIDAFVARVSEAFAPIALPLLDLIGDLELDEGED